MSGDFDNHERRFVAAGDPYFETDDYYSHSQGRRRSFQG
jgi:hypothetical protein